MALARGKADYLLLLDADWAIDAKPRQLAGLSADAYVARFVAGEGIEALKYVVVRSDLPWRWIGVVHEYLDIDDEISVSEGRLDGVSIRPLRLGGVAKGRLAADEELLARAVDRDPADARSMFYLAQTIRDRAHLDGDRGGMRDAARLYLQRARMTGWDEETYCAWHLAGVLFEWLGDWTEAEYAFRGACEQRPQRLEARVALARTLRTHGLPAAAHELARIAADALAVPDDALLLEPWVYEWGLLLAAAILQRIAPSTREGLAVRSGRRAGRRRRRR